MYGKKSEAQTIGVIMKTDDICERYADRGIKLTIKMMEEEDGELPMVLIQGKTEALKFLADLLNAIAEGGDDCNRSLSPDGPGSTHFSKQSNVGFYIERL